MSSANAPTPLDTLRAAWQQADASDPPDLSAWLTAEVREDEQLLMSLLRVDNGERDRLGLERGWDHYRRVLGTIPPASPIARWLIERELDRLAAESDDPLAELADRLGPDYAEDIEEAGAHRQTEQPPETETASMDEDNAGGGASRGTGKGQWVGRVIGHYKLHKLLGAGGFGEVYAARHVRNSLVAAVKLVRSDRVNEKTLKRFEVETEAMKRLGHPNVAKIYEGGVTEEGVPFIAMEFIQGVPFNYYCDNRRLSIDQRLELFLQVCDGVDHIHTTGLIHRDLSPDNILVAEEKDEEDGKTYPVPKIIDLGVAGVADQGVGLIHSMTLDLNTMIGKLAYMSPEMAEGGRLGIDVRTDVFSLGVMLYEQITGDQPISEQKLRQMALDLAVGEIRKPRPTPSTVYGSLDEDSTRRVCTARDIASAKDLRKRLTGRLQHLPMTALNLDRNKRFKNVALMATDIRNYLDDRDYVFAHTEPRLDRLLRHLRNHKLPYAAAAIVMLTLTAGIVGTTIAMQRARVAEDLANRNAAIADEQAARALRQKDRAEAAEQVADQNARESEKGLKLFERSYGQLTAMHIAAAYNNTGTIEQLLSGGVGVDEMGGTNKTPLFLAAEFKNKAAIEILLSNGADPAKAIIGAVLSDDPEVLALLRSAGADLHIDLNLEDFRENQFYVSGYLADAMLLACEADRSRVLDYLIREGGFAVNQKYDSKYVKDWQATPLSIAIRAGNNSTVKTLLEAGAKLDGLPKYMMNIDYAADKDYDRVISLLIDAGLDINASYGDGKPLLYKSIGPHFTRTLNLLLQHGADPNARRASTGDSALRWAIILESVESVNALLEAGASPTLANKFDMQPVSAAISADAHQLEMVQLLCKHGLSIDTKIGISDSRRIIHRAIIESRHDLVVSAIQSITYSTLCVPA